MRNLFDDLPVMRDVEAVEPLLAASDVRIERIVSRGHASPPGFWYDQEQREWVIVLQGAAKLLFEDSHQPMEMRAGDFVEIAAHRRHRVEWTAPDEATIWLAVFYGSANHNS